MRDVDDLLDEEGMLHDAKLRAFLTGWSADATAVRPLPSPEVSAHMRRRRGLSHRTGIIIGVIVIGSVGAGAGAAAASPEIRQSAGQVMGGVIAALVPAAAAPNDATAPTSGSASTTSPTPKPTRTPTPSSTDGLFGHHDPVQNPGQEVQHVPPAVPLDHLPTDLPTQAAKAPFDPGHGVGRVRGDHDS